MTAWMQRLAAFGKGKGRRLLLALGVLGILLIALSEWLPHRAANREEDAPSTLPIAQVEAALEKRIADIISQVEGVGSCRVMVTLESGSRFVYAADSTYNQTAGAVSGSEKILQVETDNGPIGLPVAEIQPTVKGVVVVCDGGRDPSVCRQVTSLVSAAFNISSGRVCVAKQK